MTEQETDGLADLAQRLRVLRDLLHLCAEQGRETVPELASALWLAEQLVVDVEAATADKERGGSWFYIAELLP